jgi:hypothetical protein
MFMRHLLKITLPVLTILSCLLAISCKKEYSCEDCQDCRPDTTINIKDTAWRFNIGSKLYFGDLQFSTLIYDKHGFAFYGYSLHSPGAIFNLALHTSAVSFDHDIYNLSVDSISFNYGSNGTTLQKIEGFNNINNWEPRYVKGIIKTFDTSSNIVEGYFCGIAFDDNSNPVKITNGRFRVKIN